MSRIRSTHPGQWTDEDFISCSFPARLLAIAIRNEADDNGVFEWKPVGIKIRLFPMDNVDIVALLNELISKNQIISYEINGHKYGAVRNFCRYQRPKKPNSVYPMTDESRTYVALSYRSVELVGNQYGTGGEKSSQRKEEGGKIPYRVKMNVNSSYKERSGKHSKVEVTK